MPGIKAAGFMVMLFLLLSCSKDAVPDRSREHDRGNAESSVVSTAEVADEVVSAEIVQTQPVSSTHLSLHYRLSKTEDSATTYIFRWYVDDAIVQENGNPNLEPGSYRKGSTIYAEIIPMKGDVRGRPYRTNSVEIGNLPPSVTSIALDPLKPVPGCTITALPSGEDPDEDTVSFAYKWTVNGEYQADVPEDSNLFSTKGLKKGDIVCVVVIPSDGESEGSAKMSDKIVLYNSAPQITSTPPLTLDNDMYRYQVVAQDPDNDKLVYRLESAPQGMVIDGSSGLIQWEVPKSVEERREIQVKVAVDDGGGGVTSQEFSFFLEP